MRAIEMLLRCELEPHWLPGLMWVGAVADSRHEVWRSLEESSLRLG